MTRPGHSQPSPAAWPPHRSRRGRGGAFTVMELVVAMALTSIVVLGAFGILGLLHSADRVTNAATSDAVELAYAQGVIRNAISNLQAARPIAVDEENADASDAEAGEDEGDAEIPAELRDRIARMTQGQLSQTGSGIDPRLGRMLATADLSEPPYFELWFEEIEGATLPRLRVVVSSAPDRDARNAGRPAGLTRAEHRRRLAERWAGKIRGVFELLWGGDRGWVLVWTPEDPAGDPVPLIDRVVSLRWEVLLPPLDESGRPVPLRERAGLPAVWEEVHAAYLERDFPDAVRLFLETESGSTVDWLFETGVTAPTERDP